MKRRVCLVLCVLLSVFCLGGCDNKPDKNGFFSQKKLDHCLIPDLPKIKCENSSLKEGRYTYVTTEEEFVEYLDSVFAYLVECSFEYFGYPTEVLSTFFGGAPKCAFQRGSELSEFQTDLAYSTYGGNAPEGLYYFFVWGNDGLYNDTSQIFRSNYMKICFVYGSDGRGGASIELPYSLMDYRFYITESES